MRDNMNSYPEGLTPEEWSDTLTELSESFKNYKEDEFSGVFETYDDEEKRIQRGLDLLSNNFSHLWD